MLRLPVDFSSRACLAVWLKVTSCLAMALRTQCELMLVHQLVAPGLADKHPPGHLHEPPASTRLDQNLESKSIAGTANGASGWGAVLVVLVQC